jgi:nucleotide-binding universal stress UspA family protein
VFEKILVSIDGSENSLKALKVASEIAKKCDSEKLALVNVYSVVVIADLEHTQTGGFMVNPNLYQDLEDAARRTSARILEDGKSVAKAHGVPVDKIETLSTEGHVVETIVRVAREGDFGLIVLGHRGTSRFETLLGSVSHGVTRHATCPVLVVR